MKSDRKSNPPSLTARHVFADLVDALTELVEQTVEQDLKYDIALTEGEKAAYRKAKRALADVARLNAREDGQ